MTLTAEQRRRQREITAAIAGIDYALPGSIEIRHTQCGTSACRCHTEPDARHGPYIVWTRKVKARTVTRVLTPEQLHAYRPWLDNARQLRQLVDELHQLTLQIVEADRPQPRRSPGTGPRTKISSPAPDR